MTTFPLFKTLIVDVPIVQTNAIGGIVETKTQLAVCLRDSDRLNTIKLKEYLSSMHVIFGFTISDNADINLAAKPIAEEVSGFKSGAIPPIGTSHVFSWH